MAMVCVCMDVGAPRPPSPAPSPPSLQPIPYGAPGLVPRSWLKLRLDNNTDTCSPGPPARGPAQRLRAIRQEPPGRAAAPGHSRTWGSMQALRGPSRGRHRALQATAGGLSHPVRIEQSNCWSCRGGTTSRRQTDARHATVCCQPSCRRTGPPSGRQSWRKGGGGI